ncbi:shikimate dehydrogenase [Candidatus Bathyarchaeota archaeon]|nr:shikimate dehydrogenase [Candidatus Bathyarchaeota archaeon]
MKFCYLLGYPVEHSMSAIMHNAAFNKLNLDYEYKLLSVKPEKLEKTVEYLRNTDIIGANVTIPHKISIIPYLDEIDPLANEIGAVNTILNKEGKLKGYNTDGVGALKALKNAYGDINESCVTILGAGGAARAIGFSLIKKIKKLLILNRNKTKADNLASSLKNHLKNNIFSGDYSQIDQALLESDILINATPVGMIPNISHSPIEEKKIPSTLFVFDLVYNPMKTKLLHDAELAGAKILGGVEMLVYQGAESFKIWTGYEPDDRLMMQTVKNHLECTKI